jgi:hypothetical protein
MSWPEQPPYCLVFAIMAWHEESKFDVCLLLLLLLLPQGADYDYDWVSTQSLFETYTRPNFGSSIMLYACQQPWRQVMFDTIHDESSKLWVDSYGRSCHPRSSS